MKRSKWLLMLTMSSSLLLYGCQAQADNSADNTGDTTKVVENQNKDYEEGSDANDSDQIDSSSSDESSNASGTSDDTSENGNGNDSSDTTEDTTDSSETKSSSDLSESEIEEWIVDYINSKPNQPATFTADDFKFDFSDVDADGNKGIEVRENHDSETNKELGADPTTSPLAGMFRVTKDGALQYMDTAKGPDYITVGSEFPTID